MSNWNRPMKCVKWTKRRKIRFCIGNGIKVGKIANRWFVVRFWCCCIFFLCNSRQPKTIQLKANYMAKRGGKKLGWNMSETERERVCVWPSGREESNSKVIWLFLVCGEWEAKWVRLLSLSDRKSLVERPPRTHKTHTKSSSNWVF